MKTFIALSFAMLAFATAPAFAQTDTPVRITTLMSPRDLEATGVRGLTSQQIDALSAWLDNYRASAEWLAVTAAQGEDMIAPDDELVETVIDGDFDGWVGNTVFRLQNGQIWQQVGPSARYMFARAPKVTISRAPYRMRVDGMTVEIAVKRLR